MNDAEWLTSGSNPFGMLQYLQGQQKRTKPSSRKLRLIAVACAQRIWGLVPEEYRQEFVTAVSVAERFADGEAGENELLVQYGIGYRFHVEVSIAIGTCDPKADRAAQAVIFSVGRFVSSYRSEWEYPSEKRTKRLKSAEYHHQSRLIRSVLGNPFRPVAFSPEWRTDTAVTLARQMYESREFGAMPILADALQDAGCDNEDILNHCRGDKPHVRGCWVVDLVLGEE